MADVYQRIENDHNNHRQLLNDIAATQGNFETRRDLWKMFYYDVKAHAAAEEETFYSKLMSHTDGQEPARHSVAEHHELDELMEELNDMDFRSTGWLNRFAKLKLDYEHHMEEEENDIFARGRQVLSQSEVEFIGTQFERRKREERELVDDKADDKLEA